MRTKISERIFHQLSPQKEFERLYSLFCNRGAFKAGPFSIHADEYYSFNDLLNRHFLRWNLRGTFISVKEMMGCLGISVNDFMDPVSEDKLLDFIQFLLNAIAFVDKIYNTDSELFYDDPAIENAIKENCNILMERLNAEIKEEQEELVVIYKNDVASVVSTQHPELSESIIEYLKLLNRNNIQRKREILCGLSPFLESRKSFLNTDYGLKLYENASFMLNNAQIRHPYNPNDPIHAKFQAMSSDVLIKWYDRTFQMILACIALLPYLEFRQEILELRDKKKNS